MGTGYKRKASTRARRVYDQISYNNKMTKLSLRTKILALVVGLGLILIAIFKFGFGGIAVPVTEDQQPPQNSTNEPALISTEPKELFEKKPLIFKPDEVIKLNFNVQLQNEPETKLVLDPPHEIDVKLSGDRKTAIITPKKPYKLGQGYTLFIKSDTKLHENGKTLGKGYDMHFNVINYSGI